MLVLPYHTVSVTVASLRSSLHFSLSLPLSLSPSYYQSLLSLHLPPSSGGRASIINHHFPLPFSFFSSSSSLFFLHHQPTPASSSASSWSLSAHPSTTGCLALDLTYVVLSSVISIITTIISTITVTTIPSARRDLCPLSLSLSLSLPLFLFRTLSPPPPPPRYHIPIINIQPALF